ncbi:MAG TPA: GGDEF domain-containing protein [Candidatus Magasanikbacteria bacterium]|nr:GGDEF domain-containing protein [Candidatus Magasanikbacteria bacterium]
MSEVRKPGESEVVVNKQEVGSVPASEKKPRSRSGNRVEGKTKVFVSENEGGGEFIGSSEIREKIDEILVQAAHKLEAERLQHIKLQFERGVVNGLRKIAEKKNEEPGYDVSGAKGAFYSAKMEQLKHVIEFEINNNEQIKEIFEYAGHHLKAEVVENLKNQFNRSVERARNENVDHYDASEQIKALRKDVDEAIQNSKSLDKEDRLIPELKTRRAISGEFAAIIHGLSEDEKVVLVALDLDGFKQINDALGHVTGDKVLRSFGISLYGAPRPDDVVAHYSGDEFGLLLKMKRKDDVQSILKRILEKAQDDKSRPVEGRQEVSTGFVEVNFEDKEQIDFETARERSDEAAKISKILDILFEMRGTKGVSTERIVEYAEREKIQSQFTDEEWKVANKVRGLKREFGDSLSIGEMVQVSKMILSGEMKKILAERNGQ